MSCNLIIFSFAKRGVLCSSNLAKLIIRIVLFYRVSNDLIFEQYPKIKKKLCSINSMPNSAFQLEKYVLCLSGVCVGGGGGEVLALTESLAPLHISHMVCP